jgi:pyruvate dehydrogenase E2 component (dihydrolipoamide acetyltransferase)
MAHREEVMVPDIGDFDEVDVVEVLVAAGDRVAVDQSLITLESEKASLEVPSPVAGTVRELRTKVGDKVGQGAVIAIVEVEDVEEVAAAAPADVATVPAAADRVDRSYGTHTPPPAPAPEPAPAPAPAPATAAAAALPHASPSVRRMAREFGVDLGRVSPSGRNGRIVASDVRAFVKQTLAQPPASGGLPPMPDFDPAKFGPVEIVPLSKINKLAARNVHRSWLHIPHVTQFDEADITDLEAFRREHAAHATDRGFKLTFVAFVARAAAAALLRFPRFNASLLADGENLALRRYINIGIAVDTDQGLVVPVIRDADRKTILEVAAELAEVSERARQGKMTPKDAQGATFTISSLGGIGGTGFTPIINAPEVAILGVSRADTRPVYRDDVLLPRLILPLALSYDHRVIDGAAAARFTRHLCDLLGDMRRVLLG